MIRYHCPKNDCYYIHEHLQEFSERDMRSTNLSQILSLSYLLKLSKNYDQPSDNAPLPKKWLLQYSWTPSGIFWTRHAKRQHLTNLGHLSSSRRHDYFSTSCHLGQKCYLIYPGDTIKTSCFCLLSFYHYLILYIYLLSQQIFITLVMDQSDIALIKSLKSLIDWLSSI